MRNLINDGSFAVRSGEVALYTSSSTLLGYMRAPARDGEAWSIRRPNEALHSGRFASYEAARAALEMPIALRVNSLKCECGRALRTHPEVDTGLCSDCR